MKDSFKDLTSWPPTSPLITMENGTSSSLPIKKSNGVVEGGSFDQVWEKIILPNQNSSFNVNLLRFWRRSLPNQISYINANLLRFWIWATLGTRTRRRDHKGCPGIRTVSIRKKEFTFQSTIFHLTYHSLQPNAGIWGEFTAGGRWSTWSSRWYFFFSLCSFFWPTWSGDLDSEL